GPYRSALSNAGTDIKASRGNRIGLRTHHRHVRPAFLECTACSKRYEVRLINTCDCDGPLFARYEWTDLGTDQLAPRKDLWRYGPLLPLTDSEIHSRGEGGTPLHRLQVFGSGGRVAPIKVEGLYVKDEGRNPTGTFKARGMAVAVPMARALGATHLVAPTAGNAGAALALYSAVHGVGSIVLLAKAGSEEAAREALLHGAHLVRVDGDIAAAGRIATDLASTTETFNVATLREPYRVEGKKTILFEIWEALHGLPDWIVFPTGGGTGIVGMWKALHELRDLGWFEGPGPRFAVVQAAGCAPLVKAWKEGKETAAPWPEPRTEAAGLCVPSTIADGRRGPDATRAHEASFLTSAKTAFGSGGTFGSSVTHLYRTTPPRSRTNTDRLATPSRPKLPKRSYWTP